MDDSDSIPGHTCPQELKDSDTLFFTGYAKLPEGITAAEVFSIVGIGVEVNRNGDIVRADCTLATEAGRDFVSRILEGHNLCDDLDVLIAQVKGRYHGNAKKAIITALKTANDRFKSYRGQK